MIRPAQPPNRRPSSHAHFGPNRIELPQPKTDALPVLDRSPNEVGSRSSIRGLIADTAILPFRRRVRLPTRLGHSPVEILAG